MVAQLPLSKPRQTLHHRAKQKRQSARLRCEIQKVSPSLNYTPAHTVQLNRVYSKQIQRSIGCLAIGSCGTSRCLLAILRLHQDARQGTSTTLISLFPSACCLAQIWTTYMYKLTHQSTTSRRIWFGSRRRCFLDTTSCPQKMEATTSTWGCSEAWIAKVIWFLLSHMTTPTNLNRTHHLINNSLTHLSSSVHRLEERSRKAEAAYQREGVLSQEDLRQHERVHAGDDNKDDLHRALWHLYD